MKRLIAAIIIFGLIFSVCVAEQYITDGFEKSTKDIIDTIKSRTDIISSKDDINELKKMFEKSEISLSLFVNKEIVDDIERSIYRLSDYKEINDLFFSEISTLETELKELKRSSGIFLNSIF